MARIKRSVFALEQEYICSSYIDDVVAKIEANDGTPIVHYYHSDRQFNVRGLTDISGNIKELYAYSPYGKQTILNSTGDVLNSSDFNNNYGFTGRYLDIEVKLCYFRGRYYSTEDGRFISRDPLGFVDGHSLYNGYFAERFMLDPTGLWKIERNEGAKAKATVEKGDTLRDLAQKIGLDIRDKDKWISYQMRWAFSDKQVDENLVTIEGYSILNITDLDPDKKLCKGSVEIPNTIINYWAGDLGWFGKIWVGRGTGSDSYENDGFKVIYKNVNENSPVLEYASLLEDGTKLKSLHGTIFQGHGYGEGGFLLWGITYNSLPNPGLPSGKSIKGEDGKEYSIPSLLYRDLQLSYKLSIVKLYACGTAYGKNYISSETPGSTFHGYEGTYWPGPGGLDLNPTN